MRYGLNDFFQDYREKFGADGDRYAMEDLRASDMNPDRLEHLIGELGVIRDNFRFANMHEQGRATSEAISDLLAFQGVLSRMRSWMNPTI